MAMEPLRGFIGLGLYTLFLAIYWLLQTAYVLDHNVNRKDGKLRRWRFSCKSDSRTAGSSGSPASTVDSGLAVDRPNCPATFWCVRAQRWPLEPAYRLLLSLIAASSEIAVAALHGTLNSDQIEDVQRATVYALLALSGLVDLLAHFRWVYPLTSGHFVMGVAFAVQGAFFWSADLESKLAALLMGLAALASLVEVWCDRSTLSRLPKVFFVLTLGTWLLHVGVHRLVSLQDGMDWTQQVTESPVISPWTGVFFAWHVAGSVLTMLVTAGLTRFAKAIYRKSSAQQSHCLSCCPCSSNDDEAFRASPTDDLEETEPLALQP